jgi:hypothetical protein
MLSVDLLFNFSEEIDSCEEYRRSWGIKVITNPMMQTLKDKMNKKFIPSESNIKPDITAPKKYPRDVEALIEPNISFLLVRLAYFIIAGLKQANKLFMIT